MALFTENQNNFLITAPSAPLHTSVRSTFGPNLNKVKVLQREQYASSSSEGVNFLKVSFSEQNARLGPLADLT